MPNTMHRRSFMSIPVVAAVASLFVGSERRERPIVERVHYDRVPIRHVVIGWYVPVDVAFVVAGVEFRNVLNRPTRKPDSIITAPLGDSYDSWRVTTQPLGIQA